MQIDLFKILSELKLNLKQIQKIALYRQELARFNQKFSLISRQPATTGLTAEVLGILDSVVAGQILLERALPSPIADIGSGAGFPGLILAILDLDREFWLYEINQKKAGFLEYMAYQLNLKNIKIKNIPIQQEQKALNQAVSKAFFPLLKRLELTSPAFKEGARYYHLGFLQGTALGDFPSYKVHVQQESHSSNPDQGSNKININQNWQLVSVEKYSHPPLLSERALLRTDYKVSSP